MCTVSIKMGDAEFEYPVGNRFELGMNDDYIRDAENIESQWHGSDGYYDFAQRKPGELGSIQGALKTAMQGDFVAQLNLDRSIDDIVAAIASAAKHFENHYDGTMQYIQKVKALRK